MERLENATVGDIVATDFRAAAIFDRFGIDFCCGGRRTLADACCGVAADPADVLRALSALPDSKHDNGVTNWSTADLIDHITSTHHAYVRRMLGTIMYHVAKLQDAHGERHPELARVIRVWSALAEELTQHLIKEEQVLFPYIHDLLALDDERTCAAARSPFGTVENPIRMMEREHLEAADALRTIRELTNDYTAPADGCATYAVCMAELAEFERDLHRHVHLENNVLFPRVVALEQRSWGDDGR